jgi:hypothetical protein
MKKKERGRGSTREDPVIAQMEWPSLNPPGDPVAHDSRDER